MSFDLNGKGGSVSFSGWNWAFLLKLAIQYGWEPEGTRNPLSHPDSLVSPDTIDPEWPGNYNTNDCQLVTDTDARSLGQALVRAADDIRKRDPRKSYDRFCQDVDYADYVPLIVELGDFAVSGGFRIY